MMNLMKQGKSFILISGMGFIIDFTVYCICTKFIGMQISYSNMISAIPAITYVFFISTKKIFNEKKTKLPIIYKYLIYFIYQIILITLISVVAQRVYYRLYDYFIDYKIIEKNLKIIIKIGITPITMFCNFIVMKILLEELS